MIIVTGANGFIGSALIWFLNQRGESDILAVDSIGLSERPELLSRLKFKKFVLRDDLWPELAALNSEVKWVFHMGACSDTTELDVEYLKRVNTDYTRRLFEWCTEKKTGYIFASSGAVYGQGEEGFSDLSNPEIFKPLNPYGESKLNFDKWVVTQTKTPPHWYGLRFFNVYGPNEYYKKDMSSVVFKAFHQIQKTGKLKLFKSQNPKYKDGEQMRDFVYVKDICRWMLELTELHPKNGIYNMGYGKARTWMNLAQATFRSMGLPTQIDWMEIPDSLKDRYQYFTEANMQKWKSQGLSGPEWDIEKGVQNYIQNHMLADDPHLHLKK